MNLDLRMFNSPNRALIHLSHTPYEFLTFPKRPCYAATYARNPRLFIERHDPAKRRMPYTPWLWSDIVSVQISLSFYSVNFGASTEHIHYRTTELSAYGWPKPRDQYLGQIWGQRRHVT